LSFTGTTSAFNGALVIQAGAVNISTAFGNTAATTSIQLDSFTTLLLNGAASSTFTNAFNIVGNSVINTANVAGLTSTITNMTIGNATLTFGAANATGSLTINALTMAGPLSAIASTNATGTLLINGPINGTGAFILAPSSNHTVSVNADARNLTFAANLAGANNKFAPVVIESAALLLQGNTTFSAGMGFIVDPGNALRVATLTSSATSGWPPMRRLPAERRVSRSVRL
jgi:hypothetical protein